MSVSPLQQLERSSRAGLVKLNKAHGEGHIQRCRNGDKYRCGLQIRYIRTQNLLLLRWRRCQLNVSHLRRFLLSFASEAGEAVAPDCMSVPEICFGHAEVVASPDHRDCHLDWRVTHPS